MATQLVLWDIDHTLLDTGGVGRALFAEAFRKVTGLEMERQARVDGLTESVIFRTTAELHGLTVSREDFETFAGALAEEHRRRAAVLRERGYALPGAATVLRALAHVPGVMQTVVTGNARIAAEIKLATFGLDRNMDLGIGAYGDEDDERSKLVALALHRAGCAAERSVLVGDTPTDVQAGLDNGVRVVGVATGRSSEDELREAGAQTVVPDLTATQRLVNVLTGKAC